MQYAQWDQMGPMQYRTVSSLVLDSQVRDGVPANRDENV